MNILTGFYLFAFVIAFGYIYKKWLGGRLFAFVWSHICRRAHKSVHQIKKQLYDQVFDEYRKRIDGGEKQELKILEIGVGSGANFSYYPNNCSIICTDKSDYFLNYLHDTIEHINRTDLKISKFLVNSAENLADLESNSCDAVIDTFCLCSVDDVDQSIKEINRVLKPGGVYLFIDHSVSTESLLWQYLQRLINPVWSFLFDNCHFRDIECLIKTSSVKDKFEKITTIKYYMPIPVIKLANPVIYGFATKK